MPATLNDLCALDIRYDQFCHWPKYDNTVAVLSTFNCFNLFQRESRLRDAHLITSSFSEELTKAWKTNFSRHFSSDSAVQNYFNTNKQILDLDDVVVGTGCFEACARQLSRINGAIVLIVATQSLVIDRQQSNETVNQNLKRIYNTLNKLSAGTLTSKS